MQTLKRACAGGNVLAGACVPFVNPVLQSDTTANDSDKTFTVPSNKIWEVLWTWIELTSTATVGNRRITLLVRDDSDDVILDSVALNTQAASVTEYYLFSPLGQEPKETTSTRHFCVIPPKLYLPSGFDLRILDSATIDAAADDMNVFIMVNEWDIQDVAGNT